MRFFERTVTALARAGAWLAAAITLAMAAAVGYGVVLRYVFGRPQTWVDELVSYLVVFAVMLAAAETLRRGEHIAIDLVTERLGPWGRRRVEIAGLAAVMLVSFLLLVSGWQMLAFSRLVDLRSTGYLDAPLWIPQAAVPLGLLLLLLAALQRLLRLLRERGGGEGEGGGGGT